MKDKNTSRWRDRFGIFHPWWDLKDPDIRYWVWRNKALFMWGGWLIKNTFSPDDTVFQSRLAVCIESHWLYTVVVFL